MFDPQTAELIRRAPPIRNINPQTLPQDLTATYAELVALRLQADDPAADIQRAERHRQLLRTATIYEALVDTGAEQDSRRSAAFVAATAYQILGRVSQRRSSPDELLNTSDIHPDIAAPLLFLIAGQSPDAREAARRLPNRARVDLIRQAFIETLADLATERFEEILERAERLGGMRPAADRDFGAQAAQALYGMCWAGIVQSVALLMNRPAPETTFRRFDTAGETFAEVERLALSDVDLGFADVGGGNLVSAYSGPRHLARLLANVDNVLAGTGLATLPAPAGADARMWSAWIGHRAKDKPLLWPNHRPAIAQGVMDVGRSAVLVLPTGAGKTTLSELKIAATLAAGKKVIFLVPTLALVDQLRDDLAESFPSDLGGIVVSADGDLAVLASGPELNDIEVMTPERLLALLSFADADVGEVGLIVFDECHLLSPTGGGSRSIDAMLCVLHANKRAPDADFLFLSAMLTNGQEVSDWLGSLTGRPSTFYHDAWKPSRQARGVVIYPQAELLPIRAYVLAKGGGAKPKKPSVKASLSALFGLQSNWSAGSAVDVRIVPILADKVDLAIGAYGATPNANAVAAQIAASAAATDLKTIIFVQQADQAPATATRLANTVAGAERLTEAEEAFVREIAEELGATATSLVSPSAGALPHNGDMIAQERRLAESLFKRADGAKIIVATPTLAQGMNLPAQLAILAGNKRHDDDGRAELKQHELLNAAGRAGRAGHLANGTVLLIPEPVVGYLANGRATPAAIQKLRSILPASDQCVVIDDPLTELLDKIQQGHTGGVEVRYLMSRLRAGEDDEAAVDAALQMTRKSLGAFRAAARAEEAGFEQKVVALQHALAVDADEASADAMRVSAFTGMPASAIQTMSDRIDANLANLPTTVAAWIDWVVNLLRDDEAIREALLGRDADVITAITRGVKTGGPIKPAEFEAFKAGMKAWVDGESFDKIEIKLGVAAGRVRTCGRARDLALKLANRRLYMIFVAVSELAKVRSAAANVPLPNPALIEILAIAIRRGFDSAEKAAFAHINPAIRTRVGVRKAFDQRAGAVQIAGGATFRDVIQRVEITMMFAANRQ